MLLDYQMTGSETRNAWFTDGGAFFPSNVFQYVPSGARVSLSSSPNVTEGNPWWFIMDFQTAMSLKTFYWQPYSSYDVPSVLNIYGSDTGAFAGEETLLQAFTGEASAGNDTSKPYRIGTPQSFRYAKIEIINFEDGWGTHPGYLNGIFFEFIAGDYAWDSVANYVEPKNKIVGEDGWTYVRRLVTGTDEERFWSMMSMFIEDMGWEIEVVSFPEYFVAKSRGVDDLQPYQYLYFKLHIGGDYMHPLKCFGYWDSDTKVGTFPLPFSDNTYEKITWDDTDAVYGVVFRGNKDFIHGQKVSSTNATEYTAGMCIGRVPADPILRPAHTTLVSAESAGALVNMEVVSSAGFEVGNYYCMWGVGGEGRDFGIRCTAIPDSTHVTIDVLPRNYSAGSFIGTYPQTAFFYSANYLHNFAQRSTSGLLTTFGKYYFETGLYSYIDPAGARGKNILMPMPWREQEGTDQGLLCFDTHMANKMSLVASPSLNLVGASQPLTATGGGVKTITDSTKTWTIDEHIGKIVVLAAGTGYYNYGNFAEIVSNTADTLTIAYDWMGTNPGVGTTFYICDEVWQQPIDIITYTGSIKCGG